MGWHDEMLEAMARYVRHSNANVKEVTGWEQEDPSPYYCETCGPDPIRVRIDFLTHGGKKKSHWFYGDLGELIRELT